MVRHTVRGDAVPMPVVVGGAAGGMTPFFERQRGGLCRMHALNAYFGCAVYAEDSFQRRIDEFDALQRERFGPGVTSAAINDAVFADQRDLVGYILGRHGVYARFVGLGAAARHIDAAMTTSAFFVYNSGHIWLVARVGRSVGGSACVGAGGVAGGCVGWQKIDSMSGVTPVDPRGYAADRNVGLIVPVDDLPTEFIRLTDELLAAVGDDPADYLARMRAARKLIGEPEVIIGAAVALLDVQRGNRPAFPVIDKIVADYYAFTRAWTGIGSTAPLIPIINQLVGLGSRTAYSLAAATRASAAQITGQLGEGGT